MGKMLGSHYPTCSSTHRSFRKHEDVSGQFEIIDQNLVFTAKMLMLMKVNSKSFRIPLRDIEKVETMNLNGMMPFGVCLYLKDGREVVVGHMNNKKLAAFIEEARQACV